MHCSYAPKASVERVYVVRRVARCGDFGGETGILDLEPIIDGFLDLQVSRLSCESLSGN
jgi:hypothetical protein